MTKDCFYFYRDWYEAAQELEDASLRYSFYEALITYALTGNKLNTPPELRGYLFQPYKQIEKARANYEEMCERNRENGAKGGRPKKTEENPNNHYGFSETDKNRRKPTETDKNPKNPIKDKDKDKDLNNPPLTPPLEGGKVGGESKFHDIFWTFKSALGYYPLFEDREDKADGVKISRFLTQPEARDLVVGLIKDFLPTEQPLYELLQNLQRMERQDQLRPMSYPDWTTATYINDNFTLNNIKRLEKVIDCDDAWEITKQAVTECRKGTIKSPTGYILSQLREYKAK